jgi:hypothetical protein
MERGQLFQDYLTLKMEALKSSEMFDEHLYVARPNIQKGRESAVTAL